MFDTTFVNVSRDGLVGYDAALTRLRSGVQLPLLVLLHNLLLNNLLLNCVRFASRRKLPSWAFASMLVSIVLTLFSC